MKLSKFFLSSIVLLVVVGLSMQAVAGLQTIGTATYGGADYNLIYDDDLEITWLDYSNDRDVWQNEMDWAAGLNNAGVLTYNLILE